MGKVSSDQRLVMVSPVGVVFREKTEGYRAGRYTASSERSSHAAG